MRGDPTSLAAMTATLSRAARCDDCKAAILSRVRRRRLVVARTPIAIVSQLCRSRARPAIRQCASSHRDSCPTSRQTAVAEA